MCNQVARQAAKVGTAPEPPPALTTNSTSHSCEAGGHGRAAVGQPHRLTHRLSPDLVASLNHKLSPHTLTTNSRSTGRCSLISSTTSFTTGRSSVLVKNSCRQGVSNGASSLGGCPQMRHFLRTAQSSVLVKNSCGQQCGEAVSNYALKAKQCLKRLDHNRGSGPGRPEGRRAFGTIWAADT